MIIHQARYPLRFKKSLPIRKQKYKLNDKELVLKRLLIAKIMLKT